MNRSQEIDKVAAALVAAQKEMGTAIKDSKNPFFKSKYADLNAIREAVLPAASKHGLTVLQPPATLEGKNYIETVVMHESGQFLSSLDEVVVSKANDPQAKLAAQTYTRRGSLQSFFNIGAEDDDGETAAGKGDKPAAPRASGFNKAAPAAEKAAEPADKPAETPAAPARRGSFGGR